MEIIFTKRFKKRLNCSSQKIQKKFEEKMDVFVENQWNPALKSHPLKGHLVGMRAFSVTGDYRVIYQIVGNGKIKLVDIGTHNQVY